MRKTMLIAAAGAATTYLRSPKGRAMVKQLGSKVRRSAPSTSQP